MGMKLKCNGKIIVNNVIIYENFLMKFFGLRFSKKLENEGILFVHTSESRFNSIVDMFFVGFSLDVIWLDKNMKIVDMTTLKPWKVKMPRRKAMYIVELEEGKAKDLRIGDLVEIK